MRRPTAPRARRHLLAAAALTTLAGFGPAAHAIDYVWTGGNYVPGTTAPEPIAAGDRLLIGGGANKFINAATLTNAGTVRWLADPLYLQNGGVIENLGSFEAEADLALVYNGGAAPGFRNTGRFLKTGGSGATVIGASTAFVNSGVVEAQVGTIRFDGDALFNAGSRFEGAGSVVMANGTNTFAGAFTSANLVLQSGVFTGSGAVANGNVSFTGGRLGGDWTIAAGQTLAGNDGANKFLGGAGTVLTNEGTLAWNSGNALYLENGARLSNQALVVANADTAFVYNGGAMTRFENAANGTVRAAAGRTLTIGSIEFVNHGTLDAEAGATIVYGGSNARFADGTRFTGAGVNRMTASATFAGGFDSQNLVIASGVANGTRPC